MMMMTRTKWCPLPTLRTRSHLKSPQCKEVFDMHKQEGILGVSLRALCVSWHVARPAGSGPAESPRLPRP